MFLIWHCNDPDRTTTVKQHVDPKIIHFHNHVPCVSFLAHSSLFCAAGSSPRCMAQQHDALCVVFSILCMLCGICAFATHDHLLASLLVIGRVLFAAVKRFKLSQFSIPVRVSFLSGAGGATAVPSRSNARQRVISDFWIWLWLHILCAEDIVH